MLKLASLDMEPRAGGLGYVFGISLMTMNITMTGERDEQGRIACFCTNMRGITSLRYDVLCLRKHKVDQHWVR